MSVQASSVEAVVGDLYERLISAWNERSAKDFSGCFAATGNVVGFDGTQMDGAAQIEQALQDVFGHHPTAQYVTIVRELRSVGNGAMLLRAVAGMIPPGVDKIKSDVNAIQSMVAQRDDTGFKIALFQNTPAQFHGRPEANEALTKELQSAHDRKNGIHPNDASF
jgi:uncharacterized protein (TIGR02246 family)